MTRPIGTNIKTHLGVSNVLGINHSAGEDGFDQRPLSQSERYKDTKLGSQPSKIWRQFDVGAVIVSEDEDFRYRPLLQTYDQHVNECGLSIIEGALRMLVESKNTPAWLAFPAGLFWCDLSDEKPELDAASAAMRLITSSGSICNLSKKLVLQGMRGFFVGVDGDGHQVPVYMKFLKERNPLPIVMPRRADDNDRPVASLEGRRQLDGPPSVFVSYCGELLKTGACGMVRGFQLGKDDPIDYVLNLTHYFRRTKPFNAISRYATASMAKASRILNAPIIASTVLVNRSPCIDPYPSDRHSFLLAVRKNAQSYGTRIAERYLPPDEIVWGLRDVYDVTLAINLFGKRS
ncbi:MAG: hypothetical protein ABIE74_10475 [Pseudomonadota bacterium]